MRQFLRSVALCFPPVRVLLNRAHTAEAALRLREAELYHVWNMLTDTAGVEEFKQRMLVNKTDIDELKNKLHKLEAECSALRSSLHRAVANNDRLQARLRESPQTKIQSPASVPQHSARLRSD
jgi:hypothetical protein